MKVKYYLALQPIHGTRCSEAFLNKLRFFFEMNSVGASISAINLFTSSDSKDIILPNQNSTVNHIAIDIGGSLAKIVYFTKSLKNNDGGRLNFVKFETAKMRDCIQFLRTLLIKKEEQPQETVIIATGGGSVKYFELLTQELGFPIQREDEMHCLIKGLDFLLMNIPYEVYSFQDNSASYEILSNKSDVYPFILVNIGSGVSILKVNSAQSYERISGTSLGGGTLWGLLSVLTNAQSFDEMLELSKIGDNRNVDMLVGDIYGADYSKIGLKATTIASSFGKVFKMNHTERENVRDEDIAASLLFMVSNNIGQIAYLNAQRHNISRIFFGGCFIRGHGKICLNG
jgi:type II pantothenate kinase